MTTSVCTTACRRPASRRRSPSGPPGTRRSSSASASPSARRPRPRAWACSSVRASTSSGHRWAGGTSSTCPRTRWSAGSSGRRWSADCRARGSARPLKHFAANNQETDRLRVSADVDERPLREIYLRGFQRVVQAAHPWTVMCSYNRVNGVYASENPWLLTTVLRDEWGFDGLVMSDWGAVNDRVVGVEAGLDLEMPASGGRTDAQLVAAVEDGRLEESVLDTAAGRLVDLVDRVLAAARPDATYDADAHHALAREAARRESCCCATRTTCSHSRPRRASRSSASSRGRRATRAAAARTSTRPASTTRWTRSGRRPAGRSPSPPASRSPGRRRTRLRPRRRGGRRGGRGRRRRRVPRPARRRTSRRASTATDIELPAEQVALLDAVLEANPRTVVVLSNGGVVRLSAFAGRVPAILESWLLGQAGGSARGRRPLRRGQPLGTAGRDGAGAAAGHPRIPRLPRRARARALRRGAVRRLPLVRRQGHRGRRSRSGTACPTRRSTTPTWP